MKHIELEIENQVGTIWLNRPDVRNAFGDRMIEEIRMAVAECAHHKDIRVLVLRGRGTVFCAGADLNWMKEVVDFSYDQSLVESKHLASCFYEIYKCPKPTVALVHGAAIGGANGLLAACDIVIADQETVFSLSEVKLGIVPAVVSPYIIKRVGEFKAREIMLTGERFKSEKAEKIGLINQLASAQELETALEEKVYMLKTSGPSAISHCKTLIDQVVNVVTLDEAQEYTAKVIAKMRQSDEGQEGMSAFLEKRKPNWIK